MFSVFHLPRYLGVEAFSPQPVIWSPFGFGGIGGASQRPMPYQMPVQNALAFIQLPSQVFGVPVAPSGGNAITPLDVIGIHGFVAKSQG